MGDTGDASNGSAGSSSSTSSRGTRTRETMQITIDSQSFVNLGQLMGGSSNGHGISGSSSAAATLSGLSPGGTASANNNLGASSFLSESSDSSLRDFDHIFHPAESNSSAWSGHGVCSDKEDAVHEDDEDDSDSILPALPPRSPTPGSPTSSELNSNRCPFKAAEAGWADDIINAASAGGGSGNFGPCVLDASADGKCAGVALVGGGGELGDKHACVDKEVVTSHTENNTEHRHVQSSMQGTPSRPSSTSSSPSSSYASRTVGDEDATAGDTAALSSSTSLLRESWLHVDQYGIDQGDNNSTMEVDTETKVQQEEHGEEEVGGAGGCACGERARRIGAVLGECGSCFACGVTKAAALVRPRVQQLVERAKVPVQAGAGACQRGQQALAEAADNVPQAPVRMWLGRIAGSLVLGVILGGAAAYYALPRATNASALCNPKDATSPWWNTPESSTVGTEQSFADRLNKALFAARAGEAAAQQGLLEEVRNILAATGKSGGISAEQILRQFNAKRFTEASKAWSAAEGIAGSDPLDPLFFSPPSTPSYKNNPSSASQHQYSAPHGADPRSQDSGTAGYRSGYNQAHGNGGGGGEGTTSSGRQYHRRPCAGGGWVC